jgi:fumarate hydratase class II
MAPLRTVRCSISVSGYRFPRPFIRAAGLIKWAAAQANHDLGLLDAERSALIVQAAERSCRWEARRNIFPLEHFSDRLRHEHEHKRQRSNRQPLRSAGARPSDPHEPVHPNDHVNMGQSSNDVIPSAIHIAAAEQLKKHLICVDQIAGRLGIEAKEFWHI